MKKIIVCVMRPDWIKPYCTEGRLIPVVLLSSHPNYGPETRFDYGFLQVALEQGYSVFLLNKEKNENI